MAWIERSIQEGRDAAEEKKRAKREAEEDQAAYDSEEISIQKFNEFIDSFKAPVDLVLADLREAGYEVSEPYYGEFYMEPIEEGALSKYSDIHREVSTTPHGKTHYYITYGVMWTISPPGDMHNSIRLKMFPVSNQRSHFGGIEFQTQDYARTVTSTDELAAVETNLQTAIGAWIEALEAKR
jgi:hypothetical protein